MDAIDPDYSNPIMSGITLPERARARRSRGGGGRISADEKREWLEITSELMARGVRNPTQLRRLTGLTWDTCKSYIDEVQMRQAFQLDSVGELETRRENLFWEADAVAKEAFRRSFEEEHAASRVGYLRLVLEANKRKAALCGLDSVNLNVETRHKISASIDIVSDVAQKLNLPIDALEKIGRDTALALSNQILEVENEAIEAEISEKTKS
tara:strand:- start:1991 stop:2623 length:633 start_codon:yes stop_codon:yes gene_type:complete